MPKFTWSVQVNFGIEPAFSFSYWLFSCFFKDPVASGWIFTQVESGQKFYPVLHFCPAIYSLINRMPIILDWSLFTAVFQCIKCYYASPNYLFWEYFFALEASVQFFIVIFISLRFVWKIKKAKIRQFVDTKNIA